MSDIEFGNPPKIPRPINTPKVAARLAPLKERPGEWAKIYGPTKTPDQASSWAHALRTGRFVGIPRGEYESTSRFIDGQGWVWARYVGNGGVS